MTFLTDANLTPKPIFYQHMTNVVFRGLINNYLIGFTEDSSPTPAVADHEDVVHLDMQLHMCADIHSKRMSMGTTSLRRKLYFA